MPYKNKEDQAAYQKRYREINRAKVNAYGQYNAAEKRIRNLEFIQEAKNKPCMDCGNSFPPYVMDFDHVEGEKKGCVSKLAHARMSLEKLQQEIDKCEVVCSNCHRIRTHNRNKKSDL